MLLLDTIGELSGLFSAADVVFMGGTLAQRGGHNILEPAFFAKPVVVGPHMENFQAIADQFREAGAWREIADASQLAEAVERLLSRPDEAAAIGRRALDCAEARRGATARALAEVRELYSAGIPRYRPAMPWFALAWALSLLWKWGGRRKQARDLARRKKLAVPVVSVGNLTVGGTGKTPCVLLLAELLKDLGRRPGILTRGYGRGTPDRQLALAPGAAVNAEHSGDEPLIFVRSGLAPVGVGGDRYQTGQFLLREFHPDLVLLDDGFQHLRLARDVDIVLIDALNPLGGGSLVPLGRLREPAEALARADIVLITRSGFSDLPAPIERLARRWNPRAPVFRAAVEPLAWVENRTGRPLPLSERPFERASVICGIGNPQSFRHTLASLGVQPAQWTRIRRPSPLPAGRTAAYFPGRPASGSHRPGHHREGRHELVRRVRRPAGPAAALLAEGADADRGGKRVSARTCQDVCPKSAATHNPARIIVKDYTQSPLGRVVDKATLHLLCRNIGVARPPLRIRGRVASFSLGFSVAKCGCLQSGGDTRAVL